MNPVTTDVGIILLIVAIALLWKGSGQVRGFGQTMLTGTILAMLCETAVLRPLLTGAAKNDLL